MYTVAVLSYKIMRTFEYLLSLTLVLGYCWLSIPRFRSLRWLSYALLAPVIIAAAQLIFEGYRWQMVPAYILSLIFALVWATPFIIRRPVRINRALTVIGVALGLLVIVPSVALPALLPVFSLPKPTGPYGIGTVIYHWTDSNRRELFSTNPNDRREIVAQVWYPTSLKQSSQRAPYVQDANMLAPALAKLFNFPSFFFRYFKYVKSHAVTSAPIATDKSNYPVLIFLSGLNGYRQMNMFQVEELVSHGYIVVGLDQPGTEAAVKLSNGQVIMGQPRDQVIPLVRQSADPKTPVPVLNGTPLPYGIIPYLAKDVSFTIDQLTGLNKIDPDHILAGKLDLSRLGAFGISLGGMTVAQACHDDARLKACLIMDVYMPTDVVKDGLKQPTMFMTRSADDMRLERKRSGGWSEQDIALTLNSMQATYNKLQGDGYYLDIAGMFHLNFTDIPAWSPITSQLGITGPINSQRGFDIVNAYSLAFFNEELLGQNSVLLSGNSKSYPEVTIQRRG